MSGARLTIRVQAGARETGFAGRGDDGVLKLRVRERAREGRANEAVCMLISRSLGVGRSKVQVTRGSTSRLKGIAIAGITQEQLDARIAKVLAEGEGEARRS